VIAAGRLQAGLLAGAKSGCGASGPDRERGSSLCGCWLDTHCSAAELICAVHVRGRAMGSTVMLSLGYGDDDARRLPLFTCSFPTLSFPFHFFTLSVVATVAAFVVLLVGCISSREFASTEELECLFCSSVIHMFLFSFFVFFSFLFHSFFSSSSGERPA
jgi:hypothetical protein